MPVNVTFLILVDRLDDIMKDQHIHSDKLDSPKLPNGNYIAGITKG